MVRGCPSSSNEEVRKLLYLRIEHVFEGPPGPAPTGVAFDLALVGSIVAFVRVHHPCRVTCWQ